MPRAWSEAAKACRRHPAGVTRTDAAGKVSKRSCSCNVGWRYRLALPDPITGRRGAPAWSRTFPTREAADQDQRAVRQAIENKTFTRDGGKTVAAFLDEWVARKEAKGLKASTIVGYRGLIDNHLAPTLGAHRLGDLRIGHVQSMFDHLATAHNKGAGKGDQVITASTLTNVRAVLRAALNDAMRQQLVPRNVATLIELPQVKRPAPVDVSGDRLGRFLAHVESDPLAALWLSLVVYGPRRGELLGLGWLDVDQTGSLLRVRQTVLDVEGEHRCPHCSAMHRRILFDTPKSAAGDRAWPLVPEVEAALMTHRLNQDEERALYGADYSDHGLVFTNPGGGPLRPDFVSRRFKRLMRESGAAAGLPKVPSLKAMRSTMVSALHAEGAPIEVITKVTGHADSGVTREHYLSVSAERTRREYEAIAARLSGGRSDRHSDQRPQSGAVRTDREEGG